MTFHFNPANEEEQLGGGVVGHAGRAGTSAHVLPANQSEKARLKIMSNYYSISGRVELYDFKKFRDWLFEELQKQDFVGTFDINIDETSKCTCEKCGKTCQENDLYGDTYTIYLCGNCFNELW